MQSESLFFFNFNLKNRFVVCSNAFLSIEGNNFMFMSFKFQIFLEVLHKNLVDHSILYEYQEALKAFKLTHNYIILRNFHK